MKMLNKIIVFILSCFVFLTVNAYASFGSLRDTFCPPPEPRLLYPISDKVDLKGKDTLEFRWQISTIIDKDYYDFRLYKGYEMYEKNLILKKKLDPDIYSFTIDSSQFEDGQVYTWSLRQVARARGKSERSYDSFKVIKK